MLLVKCIETSATAKACVVEPQNHKSTVCDSVRVCVEMKIASLLQTFARKILSKHFDMVENAGVDNEARVYLQHFANTRSLYKDCL